MPDTQNNISTSTSTGSPNDIVARVKRVIPFRWFSYVAPLRDAVLGGLADGAANLYSFIGYARLQTRLATATNFWLDILCFDFVGRFISRQGQSDTNFRTLIQATILQERVTRAGMMSALTKLLGGVPPFIFEPWNTGDAGGWGSYTFAYGKAGGWGSLQLPGQLFIRISRSGVGPSGVPSVQGYKSNLTAYAIGGYGVGAIQYIGVQIGQIGVTDAVIYNTITYTKPTGVTCWVQFGTQNVFNQAASVIPPGGVGPFIPIGQLEAQPHFIGRFQPTVYYQRYRFN